MNAVVEKPQTQVSVPTNDTMSDLLARFVTDPNVDVHKLEKIVEMQEHIFTKNAEIEFNRAMSAAQSEMKPIVKDAENTHTRSRYALLETICEAITPIYTEHGFSLSFSEDDCPKEGYVRIVYEVTHAAGYSKTRHMDVPLDVSGTSGNRTKTDTHGFGSTFSYGRRYATINLFNLTIKGEDNDGNGSPQASQKLTESKKLVSKTQVATIKRELKKAGVTEDQLFQRASIDAIENMESGRFNGCLKWIKAQGGDK